jgi:creatinine amidohydrolase
MEKRYSGKAWNENFLPRLTTKEMSQLPKDDAMVVLPIGATEQHGAHLPVFTDTILAETVIAKTFEYLPEKSNIWTLPVLPFSKSNEHSNWSGTITLSFQTMQNVLMDIAKSLNRSGFNRLVIFNTHGGNGDLIKMMAREIRLETGMQVFYLFIGALPLDPDLFSEREIKYGIHGGDFETSLLLHSYPEWVHMELADSDFSSSIENAAYLKYQQGNVSWIIDDISASGICGDARNAQPEKGEATYLLQAQLMAKMLLEMGSFTFHADQQDSLTMKKINKEGVRK